MNSFHLALGAALLLPTAPVPQQPALPTIKVDTRLTVVSVTVTDKYGHPVHGLKQSDFTIREDGKPQPIRNFDEYGVSRPTLPLTPKLPPGIYTNQTAPASAGPVNIFLFSQLERPNDLLVSRSQAADYLKTMPPGTRATIMLLEDRVRLVQNITTDRDVINAQMEQLKYRQVGGANYAGVTSLGEFCAVTNQRMRLTLNTLRQIAASMNGIKGRKNLIWFTRGIPFLTNISYFRQFRELACLDDNTQNLQETYSMLTAAQVSIYTIDPRGIDGVSGVSAEFSGGISGASVTSGFVNRQLDQESIRDFAEKTGGRAYYNRNDLDGATADAIASGSDYYAVAYTPPLSGYDGKYHTIDVKVNKPGVQITYRKGYTSLDLAKLNTTIEHDSASNGAVVAPQNVLSPAVNQFRAQMAHGTPLSTELQLAARITPTTTPVRPAAAPIKGTLNPNVKADPLVRYDVIYSLPAGQITLSDSPDGTRKGSVEFDIVAYGQDGTKLNVLRQTANVSLKPEQAEDFNKKPFEVPLQFDLPPGKLFVRVGALDVLSGKAGTLEVPQTVAKP